MARDPTSTLGEGGGMTRQSADLAPDPRWVSSAIRDLLSHAQRPGVISLAGGLPAPEALPTERLAAVTASVFERSGTHSVQYSATAGEPALRELLASVEAVHPEDLVITTGSQQALDLVARSLACPGDLAIVDAPGYVGAIQTLRGNGLELRGCPVDPDGLDTDTLEAMLKAGARPQLVYTNPIHQNPTGGRLSPERMRHLASLAERFGFWLVVDDPYREITFDGEAPSPEDGLHPASNSRVILLGTLSKTLSPGLRIGWCSGPTDVVRRLVIAKQSADLQTATLNQLIAAAALSDHTWWIQHLQSLRAIYSARHRELTASIDRHLPDAHRAPTTGGFFSWIDLPGVDSTALLERALDAGVAFVPGSAFTIDGRPSSSFRFSHSFADPASFDDALERLAGVVSESAVRN